MYLNERYYKGGSILLQNLVNRLRSIFLDKSGKFG